MIGREQLPGPPTSSRAVAKAGSSLQWPGPEGTAIGTCPIQLSQRTRSASIAALLNTVDRNVTPAAFSHLSTTFQAPSPKSPSASYILQQPLRALSLISPSAFNNPFEGVSVLTSSGPAPQTTYPPQPPLPAPSLGVPSTASFPLHRFTSVLLCRVSDHQ
ncbi:hypothetical protein B0T21DRAFT_349353 [Apiosordaria backusii]|uniref:Uncharacterized protein n=1 Tax=Apiosordaria backusii TaxID=314023 RepID=A0AA40BDN1_9PEZI|nr:hypothetical protein B0T21DRAFT_349353 [Apiosordaria backusii]